MAGQSNGDVLQQTVDGFAARIDDYASGIANRLGSPLSGQQLSQDQAVQRWNFSPLGDTQTADATYHQLVAQGTPPGQALNQVYPMRQMLLQGADLNDSIAKAKQIAGWAAKSTGEPAPEPFQGSTLPMTIMQQSAAPPPPESVAPPSPPVAPVPAAGPPVSPMGAQGMPPMPGVS